MNRTCTFFFLNGGPLKFSTTVSMRLSKSKNNSKVDEENLDNDKDRSQVQ